MQMAPSIWPMRAPCARVEVIITNPRAALLSGFRRGAAARLAFGFALSSLYFVQAMELTTALSF